MLRAAAAPGARPGSTVRPRAAAVSPGASRAPGRTDPCRRAPTAPRAHALRGRSGDNDRVRATGHEPPYLPPRGLCSLPGSSVHGILQARILKWVAIPFSRTQGSTQGLNPEFQHSRQILSHQGSPYIQLITWPQLKQGVGGVWVGAGLYQGGWHQDGRIGDLG